MLSNATTEKYVVSPQGWLVVPPGQKVWLTPSYVVIRYRSMDAGMHNKALSPAVTTVAALPFDEDGVEGFFRIDTRAKIYYVKLVKAKGAVGPLGFLAHELQVMCVPEPCDLSVLLLLNDPRVAPQLAAATFKTLARVPRGDSPRWLWDVVQFTHLTSPEELSSHYTTVWDVLASPTLLRLLWTLTYDQRRAVRERAYMAGLWSAKPPEPGTFTTVAALALRLVLHLVPRVPCESFPRNVRVSVCQ